jgi:hypothetical protein
MKYSNGLLAWFWLFGIKKRGFGMKNRYAIKALVGFGIKTNAKTLFCSLKLLKYWQSCIAQGVLPKPLQG